MLNLVALRYKPVGRGFFIDIILLAASGVDSVSNRNEYQEYFLGGKGGRCVGLTALPPSCVEYSSTFWNPQGLSRPVMGLLYLYMLNIKLREILEAYEKLLEIL